MTQERAEVVVVDAKDVPDGAYVLTYTMQEMTVGDAAGKAIRVASGVVVATLYDGRRHQGRRRYQKHQCQGVTGRWT